MAEKQCAECSRTFAAKTNARYCSKKCATAAANRRARLAYREGGKNCAPRTRSCARCGASFVPTGPRSKYCGFRCRDAVQAEQSREYGRRRAERLREKYGERPCAHCGTPFAPTKSTALFCSIACKSAAHAAERREAREAAQVQEERRRFTEQRKARKAAGLCVQCGAKIDPDRRNLPPVTKIGRFCSWQCADQCSVLTQPSGVDDDYIHARFMQDLGRRHWYAAPTTPDEELDRDDEQETDES